MTSVHTNDSNLFFYFGKKNYRMFSFSQSNVLNPNIRRMSSNGHRHGVRLANKGSWILSDCPKVPKMWRHQQKMFY